MTDDEKEVVLQKLRERVDASFKRVEAAWKPPEKRTGDPHMNGGRRGQKWEDFEALFADDND